MRTLQFQVIGHVQGVFFRVYTQKAAKALGLKGFVKNDPDGSVTGKVTGSVSATEDFIDALWRGSPASSVEKVITQACETENFVNFEILE